MNRNDRTLNPITQLCTQDCVGFDVQMVFIVNE
jgi:hypothetical protein